ncbi:S-adenosyl-L-methionine-dependent methyltransferase [Podospora fimiseda]|uniref:S-adenosyl-L-methionine-dependent methyltransferase n=1 Tax=Podospora fimiseda TaxID=252190 RepID=A0AAN6YN79_9PEZI|nr:S-adenosyl-L-methionine-dependent methyltransferase [Podospora fimiseda]
MLLILPLPRLDEQHIFTTKTLGFLLHPNIPAPSSNAKIADIGTGTGIWLLDLARSLPSTCIFTGFDITPSAFPSESDAMPPNVTFRVHDTLAPFPAEERGTYDVVAARFLSSATPRTDWAATLTNLMTLLRPGGWLQWIDSCNFAVYNSVPGTSRTACREVYAGLDPLRKKDAVIGLMMREAEDQRREEVLKGVGFVDVHEDVFSTDRLQEVDCPGLRARGTRNVMECFLGCLEGLVGTEEGSEWTRERLEKVKVEVEKEIESGVYHTLDQVCIVGRRPEE